MHLAWMYLQFLGLHSRPPQSLMYMCCDVMCFASLEPCQDYVTIQEWHLSTLTVPVAVSSTGNTSEKGFSLLYAAFSHRCALMLVSGRDSCDLSLACIT